MPQHTPRIHPQHTPGVTFLPRIQHRIYPPHTLLGRPRSVVGGTFGPAPLFADLPRLSACRQIQEPHHYHTHRSHPCRGCIVHPPMQGLNGSAMKLRPGSTDLRARDRRRRIWQVLPGERSARSFDIRPTVTGPNPAKRRIPLTLSHPPHKFATSSAHILPNQRLGWLLCQPRSRSPAKRSPLRSPRPSDCHCDQQGSATPGYCR